MTIASILILLGGLAVGALIVVAAVKMLRGNLSAGATTPKLEPGADPDEEALAREALGEVHPRSPPKPRGPRSPHRRAPGTPTPAA